MENMFSYKNNSYGSAYRAPVYQAPTYSFATSYSSVTYDALNSIIDPTDELGGIYLGNYEAASDINLLKKYKIGAVLTVAAGTGLRYHPDAVASHDLIPAMDVDYYDMTKHFDRCFDFIDKNRKFTNVLVHCWAGVSRSATIVITYLMKKYDFSFDEAHSFVKKKRRQIYPNPGFVRQMRNFDSQLRIKRNKANNAAKDANAESKYKMNMSNSTIFDKTAAMRSNSLASSIKTFTPTPEKAKRNEYLASNIQSFFSSSMNFNLETIVKKPSEKLYEATTISKGKSPNAFVSYYPEKFSYDRYAYLRSYK